MANITQMPPSPLDAARLLEEAASLLELAKENPHRVRAYSRAARVIRERRAETMDELIAEADGGRLRGIGTQLTGVLREIHETGDLRMLRELREGVPGEVLELLAVPGLGIKKAGVLFRELGVNNLDELERACTEHRVAALRGFGEESERKILEGLHRARAYQGRYLLRDAVLDTEELLRVLASMGLQPFVVGEIRRGLEVVTSIELLLRPEDRARLEEIHFAGVLSRESVLADGECRGRSAGGLPATIAVAESEFSLGWELITRTGSPDFVESLAARAKSLRVEWGTGEAPTEEAVFQLLQLHVIPPEARETAQVAALFALGAPEPPPKLVTTADLRGVLHMHTTYSDGADSLAAMAEGAKSRGFEYIGVTDHSKSASYAGGLTEERIAAQHVEIDELLPQVTPLAIFRGIESDILANGSLDYAPEVLAQFDFIVASIHGRFRMDRAAMTARVLAALDNPFTTILGHPTGRLLLERDSFDVDLEAVLARAAMRGVAIEINANPRRLELDWRWHRRAKELGALFAICPDAHSVEGFDNLRYAVGVARKGLLEAEEIITCWPKDKLAEHFKRRRAAALARR